MKLHLQAKTTLTIALLVVFVLTASSYFLFNTASRALDDEMGERLVAIAKTSAAQLNGGYLRVLQPGSEKTRLYQSLQKKLGSMRDASEAQAIYVFDSRVEASSIRATVCQSAVATVRSMPTASISNRQNRGQQRLQ